VFRFCLDCEALARRKVLWWALCAGHSYLLATASAAAGQPASPACGLSIHVWFSLPVPCASPVRVKEAWSPSVHGWKVRELTLQARAQTLCRSPGGGSQGCVLRPRPSRWGWAAGSTVCCLLLLSSCGLLGLVPSDHLEKSPVSKGGYL